ncbi:MAG: hypothetical protein ABI600_05720 [Luteolibacter sp.]
MRLAPAMLLLGLCLGGIEGLAYWWMHPAPAGLGQPVLVYRPENRGRGTEVRGQEQATGTAQSPSSPSTLNSQLSTSSPSSSTTPLPEIVANALPELHCSTGTAARVDRDDGVSIYLAFFEWDLSDSTSVLEAFKHLPEQCMGSIGMKFVGQPPPRSYRVDGEALSFDHTVFRDPGGIIVHAFKGTWISGASSLIGSGSRGGLEQWRNLRWKAALKRFRPAYARVAQGAVRGIPDADLAWQAFEEAMLKDLVFAQR